MNLHEAISLYQLQLEANGRSEHTIAQAERHLNRFRDWLGDAPGAERDVETIDATLVARFFVSDAARLGANGVMKKPTSMNAMRSSLRAFFRFLHDAGHVRQDPTRLVRRAMCAQAPPRALSADDREQLLRVLAAGTSESDRRDHALFALVLATGIRIGSALGIRVEDVDLERAEVTLRRVKGGREDRVFLGGRIVGTLRSWIGPRRAGWLFPGARGGAMDRRHAHRRLTHWVREAGVSRRASPHSLRHTFATDLYRRTGDIFLVKQALLHRSIASTLVYAATDESTLRLALG